MKILVIGGTQFIGRHVVAELLARGDDVTLFHRGLTNPSLFPEVTHILGDRNSDLSGLANGTWDATIDTSAYFPRQVRLLAEHLGVRGGTYVHVSSVSAYANPIEDGYTEDAALRTLSDPTIEEVTGMTYGGLKALCELEAQRSFQQVPVVIVRPTYVVGPYDHTQRFTWWIEMVARGGDFLVPGPKENPFQVIDVRDLADFMVTLAHAQSSGTYHAVSPSSASTFAGFLELVKRVVGPSDVHFDWVEPSLLREVGVNESVFPLWAGDDPDRYVNAANPERAYAAGLVPRQLRETIEDVHAWAKADGFDPLRVSGFGLSQRQVSDLRARGGRSA
jgi:2'-hydroxyisoflavone reductase